MYMSLTVLFLLARRHGSGQEVVFVDLPVGYSLWWRPRGNHVNRDGLRQGHYFLWGHSGGHFRSARRFALHLYHVFHNLPNCNCGVC